MTRTTEASAEIVFFPGIRYERWTEEPKPVKKSRRRRDRLKLDD